MTPNEAYDLLLAQSRETMLLASATSLLAWDQRTMIPRAGHPHRAEQLALLSGLIHERTVDPGRGEWLAAVEGSDLCADPNSVSGANVREWRREYDRAVKVPTRLAVELAKTASLAETAWERARPESDWEAFRPHLDKLLGLKREEAEAVGYENEPYDALLDLFEPGETAATLSPLLEELEKGLRDLLGRIMSGPGANRGRAPLAARHEMEDQEALCRLVADAMGFDFEAGRMDVSAHPFSTSIGPGDNRITVRYDDHDLGQALYGAMHEAGHSLYEAGLPAEHWGAPAGQPVSLGVHESQSRLWENFVGRSLGFWRFLLPKAQALLPALENASPEDLFAASNVVAPSLIRVEADEVTYNLHVILRFTLERDLLRGDLATKDLPEAWNQGMERMLGITPPDHSSGCMQDVHWAAGLFGYFPTYSLGNLYAAQLFAAADKELGGLEQRFEQGDFGPLLEWLGQRVHSQGMRLKPRDLMRAATGQDLTPQPLLAYLEAKHARLGNL